MDRQQKQTYKSFQFILFKALIAVSSNTQFIFFTITGIMSYSFAYNCMNNALKIMLIVFKVKKSDEGLVEGLLTSSVIGGCFLGSIIGIKIIHLKSRIGLFSIDLFLIVGALLLFQNNLIIFIFGRIIMGIGCGMAPSITAIYLKHICPKEIYGFIGGLNPLSFSLGLIITQLLGFFFQDAEDLQTSDEVSSFWKYYFTCFPIIICSIRLILLLSYMRDETPQSYLKYSQDDKAEKQIQILYKSEYVTQVFESLKTEQFNLERSPHYTKKPLARRFYFILFMQFLNQNCGYNAVISYSTVIFEEVFSDDISVALTLAISIFKFILFYICISSVDRNGRRPHFLYGNFTMLVSNSSLAFLSILLDYNFFDEENTKIAQYFVVAFIFTFLIGNFLSIPPVLTIYTPELLPVNGVMASYLMQWFTAMYITLLFPIIKYFLNQIQNNRQKYGVHYCFIYFGLVNMIGQIIMHYYLVETKGKSEEEIDQFFYGKNVQQKVQDIYHSLQPNKEY